MKTVVVSANTSWYLYNFRINTIKTFLDRGFKVYIVSAVDEYSVRLEDIGCCFFDVNISQRGLNPLKELFTIYKIYNAYRKIKPDYIFNFTPKNNIYSPIAGYFSKAKIINNIAGLGSAFVDKRRYKFLSEMLYKLSQGRADRVFFQNKDDLHQFLKSKIISREKTRLIPGSGVDLSRFKFHFNSESKEIKFILIARLIKEKGIREYAKAASFLKDKYGERVQFSLLGFVNENNPSKIESSEIALWERKGFLRFHGKSDKVEDFLKVNDCVVLPSYYREGVPKSLLEAAAMGKIIITTNNIGCREAIIDEVTGFFCKAHSSESLIEAMERVINMGLDQRYHMAHEARKFIENRFDEKIVIDSYINCINEL